MNYFWNKPRTATAHCPSCKDATFIPRVQLMESDGLGTFVVGFIGECVNCHALARVIKGVSERYVSQEERRKAEEARRKSDDAAAEEDERKKRAQRFLPDGDLRW